MSLAVLLPFLLAGTPAGQTSEPYFGCPFGQTLETASDPRQSVAARLVVRCTQRPVDTTPQCPQGFSLKVGQGPDQCIPAPTVSKRSIGTISDGTSNTIVATERPRSTTIGGVTDGTSNTIAVTESSTPSPSCSADQKLIVDLVFTVDKCRKVTIAPPTSPVSVPVRP